MRWALTLTAAVALAQLPDAKFARPAPEQPLPYSHKTHVSLGLKCAQCHPNPEPGDFMTLPKTAVCMTCHASVKTDSPHIQKLAALDAEGKRVPWAPVYRVPDWVSFNHRKHIARRGRYLRDVSRQGRAAGHTAARKRYFDGRLFGVPPRQGDVDRLPALSRPALRESYR